jgi:hypothetical protein
LSFRAQAVGGVCARWACTRAPTSQWKQVTLALDAGEEAEAEAEAEADVLDRITCCFPVGTRFSCRVKWGLCDLRRSVGVFPVWVFL